MSVIDKYGLTVDVALVAIMFGTYFTGYLGIAHIAIAAFTALSLIMVGKIYGEQYSNVVEA